MLVVGIEFLFPLGGSSGNGKDDFLDIVVPEGFRIGLLLGKYRHAIDAAADLIPVDIHKESGSIGRVRIAGQVRCQPRPNPARADDGNVDPPVPLGLVLRLYLDTGQLLGHHPQKVRCPRAPAVGVIQVLIDLPHKDIPQQIQGEQGHRPQEFHIPQGQHLLDHIVDGSRQGIVADQVHIQVVSAVAPHIIVGIPDGPTAQHAGRRQKVVHQGLHPGNGIVAAGVKNQQ